MAPITREQTEHWREHGYVVVPDFLSADELARAREELHRYVPTAEEYEAAPRRYRPLEGGLMVDEFPFMGETLNHVGTHPDLIAFAEEVLGTDDVALSHSTLAGKYAGGGDYDQLLHVDYTNNTLAYPIDDDEIRDIPMILYYSDVDETLGPTKVLSQEHTRGQLLHPPTRSRDDYPEWYEREVPVTATAGSILIYSMRTFHRGSTFHATRGARFTHHIGFHNGAYRWLGQKTYNWWGGEPGMDLFIERATPKQRSAVGFPPPGHRYWTEEALQGVAARYPGLDMTPYAEAAMPATRA